MGARQEQSGYPVRPRRVQRASGLHPGGSLLRENNICVGTEDKVLVLGYCRPGALQGHCPHLLQGLPGGGGGVRRLLPPDLRVT